VLCIDTSTHILTNSADHKHRAFCVVGAYALHIATQATGRRQYKTLEIIVSARSRNPGRRSARAMRRCLPRTARRPPEGNGSRLPPPPQKAGSYLLTHVQVPVPSEERSTLRALLCWNPPGHGKTSNYGRPAGRTDRASERASERDVHTYYTQAVRSLAESTASTYQVSTQVHANND